MRQMRDSGVEFIGDIPAHWEVYKIKYLGEYRNGLTYSPSDICDAEGGTLVLRSSNVKNGKLVLEENVNVYVSCHIPVYLYVRAGDILICSRNGSRELIGKNAYIGEIKATFGAFMMIYRCQYSRYMFYVLNSPVFSYYLGTFFTATINQLTGANFGNMLIPFCPYEEERNRIVNFLDRKCAEIDALAADIQAEIDTLEQYKRSVITETVTKGLNPGVEMKDSGVEWVGEIPAHWSFPKITYILDYQHPYPIGDGDHGSIKATDYADSGIPFIRVQNLGFATELDMENVVYITEEQNKTIENSTLYPGDILFAKTGATIGKVGIVPSNLIKANATSHVGKLTVSHNIEPKYIFYFLSSYIGYKQFWDVASQKSTRPELSIDEIRSIRIILPDTRKEQTDIVGYLNNMCSEVDNAVIEKKSQMNILTEYKKSLIYEYVTGKKEVSR